MNSSEISKTVYSSYKGKFQDHTHIQLNNLTEEENEGVKGKYTHVV